MSNKKNQPLNNLEWIEPRKLEANDYNPNHMAPLESKLLKQSLMECGWTQPIVVAGDKKTIIDGFHRWSLALNDKDVLALGDGSVPIVVCDIDPAQRIASRVRHNRARGSHGIDPMSNVVELLFKAGLSTEDIMLELGMQEEEVDRLMEKRGNPEKFGEGKEYEKSWVPDKGE